MSPRSLLIERLNDFAEKSEKDLNVVFKLLNDSHLQLKTKYPNAKDILWPAERMVEKFRDSDKTIKKIEEINPIIDSI